LLSYNPIVVKFSYSRKLTIIKDNSLKTSYYLSFLLILIFQEISFPQQRGMKIQLKEGGDEIQIYDDSWAVIIGINKYTNWPLLDYAVNDAESIRDLLINTFGFESDHIFLLTDEAATLKKIKDTLSDLGEKVGKNDRVIIYFSGHGQSLDLENGGQMGFLIPVDGSTRNSRLYSSSLAMSDIKAISNFIPAKHILYLVDACYSGLLASTQKGLSTNDKLYLRQITLARGRQIITAGGKGEVSYERPEWGHGAFTYKLLEGLETGLADLNDDGIITSSELGNYLKDKVPRISNFKQIPRFKYLTEDEGEFVFLIKRKDYKSLVESERATIVNIPSRETEIANSEPKKAALELQNDDNSSTLDIKRRTQHRMDFGFYTVIAEPYGDTGLDGEQNAMFSIFAIAQYDLSESAKNLKVGVTVSYIRFPTFGPNFRESIMILANGEFVIANIGSSMHVSIFGGLGFSQVEEYETALGFNIGMAWNLFINREIALSIRTGHYKSSISGGTLYGSDHISPVMFGLIYRLNI